MARLGELQAPPPLKHGDTSRARDARARAEAMTDAEFEQALTDDMAGFFADPIGFVYYNYEWGVGELAESDGPDKWQLELLESVAKQLDANPDCTIREAVASGHGIGKTAFVAWLIDWCMSTRAHLSGVTTANTMSQLNTKTWRELALWWKRSINRHWFKWSATKFWHREHPETWFCSAEPNTEHNSEAFAGRHAKYVLIIYDEASAIPDKIWEVTEGAMTTPRAMWFVFGNPTKNTGRFKDCFEKDGRRWGHRHVDSRTCKMTNKEELNEWIDTYGLDSDFVKVRILGEFPRAGAMQFIATDTVDKAMLGEMQYEAYCLFPVVLGVDVARYGDDKSCIAVRQGRKLHEIRKFRELNTMQLAHEVIVAIRDWKAVAVFVDVVGVGAGVVDRLQMLGHQVIEVNGGETARDEDTYYNRTSEMWDGMRKWLVGADLPPKDQDMRKALIGREYYFDDKERIRMERKKDMKKRGLPSPDEADAIAHTFAEELGDLTRNSFEPAAESSFEPE